MENNRKGILLALVASILFGMSFVATKYAGVFYSSAALLGWRFLIAFGAMKILSSVGVLDVDFKGKNVWKLVRLAILVPVIYFFCEITGIQRTTVSESGVLVSLSPVVTLIIGALVAGEIPTKMQITGITLSVFGVIVMVISRGFESSFDAIGYIFLVLSVISYGFFAVFSKELDEFTSIEKTYVMMFLAAVVFFPLGLAESVASGNVQEFFRLPFREWKLTGALLYLSLGCSVVAFLMTNESIRCIGVAKNAVFAPVSTVVTIFGGVFFYGDSHTPLQMLATTVILLGIFIAIEREEHGVVMLRGGNGEIQESTGD